MKNIFRYSILLALCSFVGLVSCSPEELSTDQFSDDTVVFSGFAPNPIVRGAELRIVGSNLDKIVEVQIPGAEPITEIEVVSTGRVSEIRVVTPAAGAEDAPVTGPVVIVDNAGNTYESKTELSFTEGIVLESFTPATAMPGDVVTVKGDYLYNVQQIVLNNGVYVTGDQITEKSRRELKFIVPSNAVTGPVTIGDVDENNNPDGLIPNNVPSKNDLVIGSPTVTAAARGMLKAGAEIVVEGKYLDMIEKAAFKTGEGEAVAYTEVDFTLAKDHKSITVALPASVVEGEVVLTSFAGEEFAAGTYSTVVPTQVAIAAESRFKAGLNAVVTGKDLDLVTSATLAGTEVNMVYADNKITFAIPAAAADGTVVLTLANGNTVETEAIELVKPVITAVSPLELYAGDENIVVTGEDLDLVASATLGGREAEFEYADGQITVKTTLTSVSGKVAFTLANGVVVESADEVTVNYHSLVIVTEMPAAQHIGMEVVLKGSNYDLVENIFIGEEKVTKYLLRTPDEVRFIMPWNKVGMYNISFHLFSGDVETVATPIEVQLELQTIVLFEGEFVIGSWNGNQDLAYGAYDWTQAKPGDILQIIGEPVNPAADWWCLSLRVGYDWVNLNGVPGQYDNCTSVEVKLTKEIINHLVDQGGLILTGQDYKFSKISLIREISQETTIWEGPADPQNYAVNLELGGADNSDWRNANLQVGQTIKIYFDLVDPASWSVQIFDAHWHGMLSFPDPVGGQFNQDNWDASLGYVSFEVTEKILNEFTVSEGWGSSIILQGAGLTFTQITLQ